MADAEIVLYTNHRCPWAHRAHIALAELQLPFSEVAVDLDRPREPWYLALNPRGQVPTLAHDGAVLRESAVVAQFLADAYPSHLAPPTGTPAAALARARMAFFVDAYMTWWQGRLAKVAPAVGDAARARAVEDALAGLVAEVDPLLADAAPFFCGSARLTLAEVLTGSFAMRTVTFTTTDYGVYPDTLRAGIRERAPNFWTWAQAVAAHPSVRGSYDEAAVVASTRARIERQRRDFVC